MARAKRRPTGRVRLCAFDPGGDPRRKQLEEMEKDEIRDQA
jgi:hypothetical protein